MESNAVNMSQVQQYDQGNNEEMQISDAKAQERECVTFGDTGEKRRIKLPYWRRNELSSKYCPPEIKDIIQNLFLFSFAHFRATWNHNSMDQYLYGHGLTFPQTYQSLFQLRSILSFNILTSLYFDKTRDSIIVLIFFLHPLAISRLIKNRVLVNTFIYCTWPM